MWGAGNKHIIFHSAITIKNSDIIICVCMYWYVCVCVYVGGFVYLQHVPLQIVILYAWKDHRTRFTLYTFPSYFMLIPMAVCVLFVFLTYSRV